MIRLIKLYLLLNTILFSFEKPIIAIVQLDANNISEGEAKAFTVKLQTDLFKNNYFIIIERNSIEEIVNEQGLYLSGCVSDECVVEIGRLLGAKFMLAGSVNRIGSIFNIEVRFIDIETAENELIINKSFKNVSIEEFFESSIPEFAEHIINEFKAHFLGSLDITTNIADVDIYLSGKPIGYIHQDKKLKVDGIAPDQYTLKANAIYGNEVETTVNIKKGETVYKRFNLEIVNGYISINTEPEHSNINIYKWTGSGLRSYNTGKSIFTGHSPLNKEITPGRYFLEISRPGYTSYVKEFSPYKKDSIKVFAYLKIELLPNLGKYRIGRFYDKRNESMNYLMRNHKIKYIILSESPGSYMLSFCFIPAIIYLSSQGEFPMILTTLLPTANYYFLKRIHQECLQIIEKENLIRKQYNEKYIEPSITKH